MALQARRPQRGDVFANVPNRYPGIVASDYSFIFIAAMYLFLPREMSPEEGGWDSPHR
jgi:hypothetical protein